MRIDEPIVAVSQWSLTFARISSLVKRRSTSPVQSWRQAYGLLTSE
jgi:hypothetical protein